MTDRSDPVVPIEVVRADPSLALPAYARDGDAGLDLAAAAAVTLPPAGRQLVPTGLRVAIPDGYAGLVLPRSGLALQSWRDRARTRPVSSTRGIAGRLACCSSTTAPSR